MIDDFDLAAFAREQGTTEKALHALFDAVRAQAGADRFYVFWAGGAGTGRAGAASRRRVLLAFQTPDAALAFAQRNGLTGEQRPRLRRLRLPQLIQAVLREPAIAALLFAEETEGEPAHAGQLPRGSRIERAELLRQLAEQAP